MLCFNISLSRRQYFNLNNMRINDLIKNRNTKSEKKTPWQCRTVLFWKKIKQRLVSESFGM